MYIYIGNRRQRGHGIGAFFKKHASSFANAAAPYAKEALGNLGKHALRSGIQVVGDVAQGRNVGESFRERGREMGMDFLGDYGYQPNYGYMSTPYGHGYGYGYGYQPSYEAEEPPRKRRRTENSRESTRRAPHKNRRRVKGEVSEGRGSKKSRRRRDIFD